MSKRNGRPFTARDLKLANVFTHYSAQEIEKAEISHELHVARALLKEAGARVQGPLLGDSTRVRTLRTNILKHAKTEDPVLLVGSSGSGDEAVARAVHQQSHRHDQAFITVNCAQYQSSDTATSFFGNSTLTGSAKPKDQDYISVIELAAGGTIYFDGIHWLPRERQLEIAKLLEDQESGERTYDVRVIAYSMFDPGNHAQSAAFELDLRRQLEHHVIQLPALRDRMEDVPILADFFVKRYAKKIGRYVSAISLDALDRLCTYKWPGNLRELQSVVERAVMISTDPEIEIGEEFFDEGIRIDRYRLIDQLGSGGMGEVWRAKHQLLARPVALKLIRKDQLPNDDQRRVAIKRFQQEAQATASLQSPNTIKLFDYGVAEDGAFYIVMELLNGCDVGDLVRQYGPLSPVRAAYFLKQICRSLMESHAAGLIHRDVKPGNLFVCKLGEEYDFLKVLDFGIVKPINTDGFDPDTGCAGSPRFMAPENAHRETAADCRSDVYSVGCVAYWLLTGRYVFDADSTNEILRLHAEVPPERISETTTKAPTEFIDLVMQCLEKSPEDRPANMSELWTSLDALTFQEEWSQHDAKAWWHEHQPARPLPSLESTTFSSSTSLDDTTEGDYVI